jgi:hypothetical protein
MDLIHTRYPRSKKDWGYSPSRQLKNRKSVIVTLNVLVCDREIERFSWKKQRAASHFTEVTNRCHEIKKPLCVHWNTLPNSCYT